MEKRKQVLVCGLAALGVSLILAAINFVVRNDTLFVVFVFAVMVLTVFNILNVLYFLKEKFTGDKKD